VFSVLRETLHPPGLANWLGMGMRLIAANGCAVSICVHLWVHSCFSSHRDCVRAGLREAHADLLADGQFPADEIPLQRLATAGATG